MNTRNCFLILFLMLLNVLTAQEHQAMENASAHETSDKVHHKNSFSFFVTHTFIREVINEDKKWLAVPSFAINYDFHINEKWAVGLHNDIIIEEFVIAVENKSKEGEEFTEIKRSFPIASAVMLSYKVFDHMIVMAGGGMEFSKEENFPLVRFATEFPYHFAPNWEVLGVLSYDINIDAYDSFSLGIGISYLF